MGAGDRVKQFGRTDQPRPLVDRADSPCEQLLSRRSCSAFSGGYSLAEPQPLLVAFGTCRAKCAWRSAVSMRISMRKQRRAAGRPGALPNLRRICGHKAGAPTPQKGVRCGRPTNMLVRKRYGYGTPRALWTAVLIAAVTSWKARDRFAHTDDLKHAVRTLHAAR